MTPHGLHREGVTITRGTVWGEGYRKRGRYSPAPWTNGVRVTFPFGEASNEIFKPIEIFKPPYGERPSPALGQQNRD